MGGEGVAGKVHRCEGLDEECLDIGQNGADARKCSWSFVDRFDADRGLCVTGAKGNRNINQGASTRW